MRPLNKSVNHFSEVEDKILSGLNALSDPVRQTLTPRGGNVVFEPQFGMISITNDGVTIASHIHLKDPVENAVAQIVKQAAIGTNRVAGDGTTTSIILSRTLIMEGLKLISNGWNAMTLKRQLEVASKELLKSIQKRSKKIETDEQLEYVAMVSSNQDEEIAKNVTVAIKKAGSDGLVLVEERPGEDTEIEEDDGFLIDAGMLSPLLANVTGKSEAIYKNVPVLITDKRIYTEQEALAMLEPLAQAGKREVVIIARDFIGQSPNVFLTNHMQNKMKILLVKDPQIGDNDIDSLQDLAAYLGGHVVTDKVGKLTHQVTMDDYVVAAKVVSRRDKTLIYSDAADTNGDRKARIELIKNTLDETKDERVKEKLEKRLAGMTSGTVTIYVGGVTEAEAKEKRHRYDDAVNATLNAQKHGYVVGGGYTLYHAFKDAEPRMLVNEEIKTLLHKVCSAPLKQIAENCDLHSGTLMEKVEKNKLFDAIKDEYVDAKTSDVIEPVLVLTAAVENSISVAGILLSSRYFALIEEQQDETDNKK